MKKLLLVFFCLFCSFISLQAQPYTPLLDSVNIWHYTGNGVVLRPASQTQNIYTPCPYNTGGPMWYSLQYTGQDTLINTNSYKLLIDSNTGFGTCEFGFLREDTALKRVYFKDNIGSSEILLYDFSLTAGDSILVNFYSYIAGYSYFESGMYFLDSINFISLNSVVRKAFYLNCDTCSYSHTLIWIEGIGNLGSFVYPYSSNYVGVGGFGTCSDFPHTYDQFVTCFSHNQRIYFDSCAIQYAASDPCIFFQDTCIYYGICGGLRNESLNSLHITISPNPVGEVLNARIETETPMDVIICIWDISGHQLLQEVPIDKSVTGILNKEMDVSSLAQGFYFLECRSSKGSVFKKLVVER